MVTQDKQEITEKKKKSTIPGFPYLIKASLILVSLVLILQDESGVLGFKKSQSLKQHCLLLLYLLMTDL